MLVTRQCVRLDAVNSELRQFLFCLLKISPAALRRWGPPVLPALICSVSEQARNSPASPPETSALQCVNLAVVKCRWDYHLERFLSPFMLKANLKKKKRETEKEQLVWAVSAGSRGAGFSSGAESTV